MQFLYDFVPIILFFVVYKLYGIYAATAAAIIACFLQVGFYWIKHHNFEKMQTITLFIILILGSATIALHNPIFIKWKPSIIYWLFSLTFLGSHLIGKKPLIRYILDSKIILPDIMWKRLNFSWAIFFASMGIANLYVVYHFSTDAWVNFKLFGILGLTVVFILLQSVFLSRYITTKD